jgi:DNA replication and repair protein RecF
MEINEIKIKNFRNLKDTILKPTEKINIFLGKNAQGKTNLIESIYFGAYLKSFRTNNYSNIIKYGENRSKINLSININNVSTKYEIIIEKNKRIIKIDEKTPSSNQLYKAFNVVIFYPDEVHLIINSSQYRRSLIDKSIFYTDYNYIDTYRKYQKCLKQRNIYLKTNEGLSDIWKDQIIIYGAKIIRKRLEYIEKINNFLRKDSIFDEERFEIGYTGKYCNLKNIENFLYDEFDRKNKREKQLNYTLVGPHREDFVFLKNGLPIADHASQGQKKSLLIYFKTAQILNYIDVHGCSPVLIIDDMTSEFDEDRIKNIFGKLINISGQVFINTTNFKTNFKTNIKKFFVSDGNISEITD